MGIVSWVVDSTKDYLGSAAQTTFNSLVTSAGALLGSMAVLAVALVGINMLLQYRYMDWRTAFGLILKLTLISIFAWNWGEFWKVASAIIQLGDSLANQIMSATGGAGDGSAKSFAASFDAMLAQQASLASNIADRMGWMNGAILNGISIVLIGLGAALAALILIFSNIMITFYLGIAPIMITLSLFSVTKEYFEKWMASAISYAFYPVVIASVFGAIVAMANKMRDSFGTTVESVGDFIPFVALMLITVAAVATIPMIVGSITGNLHLANAVRTVASGAGAASLLMRGSAGAARAAPAAAKSVAGGVASEGARMRKEAIGVAAATHFNAARTVQSMAERAKRLK